MRRFISFLFSYAGFITLIFDAYRSISEQMVSYIKLNKLLDIIQYYIPTSENYINSVIFQTIGDAPLSLTLLFISLILYIFKYEREIPHIHISSF